MRRWLVALLALVLGRGRRAPRVDRERIVPEAPPSPGSELVVLGLFGLVAVAATAFIVVYAVDGIGRKTQLLGLSLGLAFAFLAAALIVIAHKLVVIEELEEDYPPPGHPSEQEALQQLVEESGDRFTRKRLLVLGGGAAGAALSAALVTPALSLGPALEVAPLLRTPWRRGIRLVDERGRPLLAHEIHRQAFYTAFPEGADREQLGAPVVVVRLAPEDLKLPGGRDGWAPQGIVAYSKICTHAACAIALYR
jgi:ubiquinol-cytochrome c reductase iron-sulfur subunit